MLNPKPLAAMSIGLIAAACSGPYDRQAPAPSVSRAMTQSERNCLDYGFAAGSGPYDRCVQRDMRAREGGRMNRDYAEARLLDDSRNACSSYGLDQGTQRYDNCVGREVDARRYREQGQSYAPPAYTPVYTPTPYYTPAPAPYADVAPRTTGVQATRDEYGFRYDAEGNRIDRNGRIISPQSTTP
jgi:hypothetical protein